VARRLGRWTSRRRDQRILTNVQGTIVQVNVSRGGIPKLAIPEGHASVQGIAGDMCAHPQFHGGPNQAILVITAESIEDLKEQGFPLFYGALGENLTVKGVDHRQFRIGQRWRAGQSWLEFTKIRRPCSQLDVYGDGTIQKAVFDEQVKAGDTSSPRWAKAGMYAAVITPGTIRTGDPFVLVDQLV
jgi:MOSC domain-containing protein YiiM